MKNETDYTVEKKKPVPRARNKFCAYKGAEPKYPFGNMKVGDSFKLKEDDEPHTVRSSSFSYGVRKNMRFIVRRDDQGAYHCWRVE